MRQLGVGERGDVGGADPLDGLRRGADRADQRLGAHGQPDDDVDHRQQHDDGGGRVDDQPDRHGEQGDHGAGDLRPGEHGGRRLLGPAFGQARHGLVHDVLAPHGAQRPLHVPVGGDQLLHPVDAGARGDRLLHVRAGPARGGDDHLRFAVRSGPGAQRHPHLAGEGGVVEEPGQLGVDLDRVDEGHLGAPHLGQRQVEPAAGHPAAGQQHRAQRLADLAGRQQPLGELPRVIEPSPTRTSPSRRSTAGRGAAGSGRSAVVTQGGSAPVPPDPSAFTRPGGPPRRRCVRERGVEPYARRHQDLNLAWLPLHHSRAARSLGAVDRAATWHAVPVPRSPEQIQQEIDAARESLAATLDQLVHRGSPQRLSAQAQDRVKHWLSSPAARRRSPRPGCSSPSSWCRRSGTPGADRAHWGG